VSWWLQLFFFAPFLPRQKSSDFAFGFLARHSSEGWNFILILLILLILLLLLRVIPVWR